MNGSFSFHRKDMPSFEIREGCLKQIDMPEMANELVSYVDEMQSGYDDPRWIEKSNSIKARDNYTCQLCHAFNPMQDGLVFVQQGKFETYHQYIADRSSYIIHVKNYEFTVNIDFYSGFHLAMPRLNVHHKVYFRNRTLWDYPDDCLVTLCENCHHYIHSLRNFGIPIIEEQSAGQKIYIGRTRPKPYQPKLNHTDLGTFHPLALVEENRWGIGLKGQDLAEFKRAEKENKQWFDYHDILDNNVVRISYFTGESPSMSKHTPEETKIAAEFIILDFIENILGYSKRKNR